MTRIGNVDHVLMLLQQQLQKLGGPARKQQPGKAGKAGEAQPQSSLARVTRISGREQLDDEAFGRALVRALLVDELGEALADDHRFDKVSAEVYRMIAADDALRKLLDDATRQAREAGK